jgi:hypothetical protein
LLIRSTLLFFRFISTVLHVTTLWRMFRLSLTQGSNMKALTFVVQLIAGLACLAVMLSALAGLVLAIATYGMI